MGLQCGSCKEHISTVEEARRHLAGDCRTNVLLPHLVVLTVYVDGQIWDCAGVAYSMDAGDRSGNASWTFDRVPESIKTDSRLPHERIVFVADRNQVLQDGHMLRLMEVHLP